VCPHCGFDPRDTSQQVAIGLLIVAIGLVILTVVSIPLAPIVGTYLLTGAIGLLVLAGIVFLLSFLVTAARFSRLFS